jgi:hypothetical protein
MNEIHQRCFHCGAFADECVCSGGYAEHESIELPAPRRYAHGPRKLRQLVRFKDNPRLYGISIATDRFGWHLVTWNHWGWRNASPAWCSPAWIVIG